MPISRRTPSDAVLEHTPEIDRFMSGIRKQIQKLKIEAKAGRSVWTDVTEVATIEHRLRDIAVMLNLEKE